MCNKSEVIFEFNLIMRIFACFGIFLMASEFEQTPDVFPQIMHILCIICLSAVAFVSTKYTLTGASRGLNFFVFRFYSKKKYPWGDMSGSMLCDLGFTYGLFMGSSRRAILRFMISDFDGLVELLSQVTVHKKAHRLIDRQSFIDYIEMRKQQSTMRKMWPTILFVISCIVFYMVVCKNNLI